MRNYAYTEIIFYVVYFQERNLSKYCDMKCSMAHGRFSRSRKIKFFTIYGKVYKTAIRSDDLRWSYKVDHNFDVGQTGWFTLKKSYGGYYEIIRELIKW